MKDIIKYKWLIYELAIRDLKLRYRKPFLGFLWMLIIPLSTALIYKVLFLDFMRISSPGYPFFIYLMTAMLPWNYLASSVQGATNSVLGSKSIVSQSPFPKYLLPISIVVANLINFFPAILVLLLFLIIFKIKISILILFLPAVILIHTCLIAGLSFLVSSLQVIYRDVEYVVQVLLTVLFFLTPGVYTLDEVIRKASPSFVKIYMLNPFVGITDLYRIVFIGGYQGYLPQEAGIFNTLVLPCLFSFGVFVGGYFVFKKCETKFSDYINI
jgi:ABC-type polysaccharide/polyol phosphate export permease